MATKRVNAYFFDDRARQAALEILGATAHLTDAFVYGEVDDADVSKLESAGLLVQEHVSEERKPLPPRPAAALFAARRSQEMADLDSNAVPAAIDYYVLKLRGPLM